MTFGVITVAREVAGRRHVIAKKSVTVRMMPVRRPSGLDTATGKLPSVQVLCIPCTHLPLYKQGILLSFGVILLECERFDLKLLCELTVSVIIGRF